MRKNWWKRTTVLALGLVVAMSSAPVSSPIAAEIENSEITEMTAEEWENQEVSVEQMESEQEDASLETQEEESGVSEKKEEKSDEKTDFIDQQNEEDDISEESSAIDLLSEKEEIKYVYAGLTWAEYWNSEGVYAAGDSSSSEEKDKKGESDKGAFDAVTRATVNHGLHRGSYQCTSIIYGEDGSSFSVAYWTDSTTAVLTDGTSITFEKGAITKPDGSKTTMDHYVVTGIKYVPVAVRAEDYEDFCQKYSVVENEGELAGGYGEMNLQSYQATASVDESTNGLKTAVKNSDGTFTFQSRKTGSTSGLKDTELKNASNLEVTVKNADGSYGEFLRVDITGDGYGELGAAMQAVRWDYYGNGDTVLCSYGTKFASDNWMHKVNGIQLGLTESLRCQLPEGTDGTGKWVLTVYALGYSDTVIPVTVTDANLVKDTEEAIDTADLQAVIAQAEALNEADYTEASWKNMQLELSEAKDEWKEPHSQAAVNEAAAHLTQAINALEKNKVQEEAPVITFTLKQKSATIYTKGLKTVTLTPVKTGTSETVTYQSSNTKVATVNAKGVVTAKKAGKATITATCGSLKATCKITVKNPSLKLKKTSASIKKNKTVTIKATVTPSGKITYKSSNKKIATVTSKGVVKGKKKGKATITVTCNGVSKKFKVTVK